MQCFPKKGKLPDEVILKYCKGDYDTCQRYHISVTYHGIQKQQRKTEINDGKGFRLLKPLPLLPLSLL